MKADQRIYCGRHFAARGADRSLYHHVNGKAAAHSASRARHVDSFRIRNRRLTFDAQIRPILNDFCIVRARCGREERQRQTRAFAPSICKRSVMTLFRPVRCCCCGILAIARRARAGPDGAVGRADRRAGRASHDLAAPDAAPTSSVDVSSRLGVDAAMPRSAASPSFTCS